jgi:hypothetical protein
VPFGSTARRLVESLESSPPQRRGFSLSPGKLSITCAMSFRAMMELALIKPEKKTFELGDCIVAVTVRQKKPPKPDNDNLPYDFWGDEMKEFLDRYDK